MIGRLFKIFFFAALAVVAVRYLFGAKQKRALHETVRISAWVFLAAAALALGWYWFGTP